MSMRLRGRLLAAIFSSGLAGAFAAPACAETLADAIALAYDSNRPCRRNGRTQRALDENYVQARSGWRPTVGVSGSINDTQSRTPRDARGLGQPIDTNGDGIPDSTAPLLGDGIANRTLGSAGLSFSQPLWTGGRVAAAVTAAQADIMAGRENLRRIEAQILATVVQAYSDVRRDQEGLRIRQENVNVLQRQLEKSRARFEVGEITPHRRRPVRIPPRGGPGAVPRAPSPSWRPAGQLCRCRRPEPGRTRARALAGLPAAQQTPTTPPTTPSPSPSRTAPCCAARSSPSRPAGRAWPAPAPSGCPASPGGPLSATAATAHPFDGDLWSRSVQTTATVSSRSSPAA